MGKGWITVEKGGGVRGRGNRKESEEGVKKKGGKK